MTVIKHIIIRTNEIVSKDDAPLQMQVIRRIMEDIYGGSWGVLIIKEPDLISTVIHWTFPDHRHRDGSAAFCLHVENGWQYNVFKTGDIDTEDRLTVEKVMEQINRRNFSHPSSTQKTAQIRAKLGNMLKKDSRFTNSLLIQRN
ncbi:hypothetical protein niasHT_001010 [Heterodera trifolii]|uniref:Uncharacterized protein n=2 Tax=Heterodera trifolii TaxID=157864 RepID=A0ABD2LVU2_9BILA